MTASAAATDHEPGRNVKAKSGLNRTLLRHGWGMARSMLESKTAWRGATLVAVPPAYTSQECSEFGHTAAQNRKTQALFACAACGHTDNAERNAAKNILRRGLETLAPSQAGCASGGEDPFQPGGRPASMSWTAGYAGTHACEGVCASKDAPRRRPRSAAQGASPRAPLAGTVSELSPSGNLHP